MLLLMEVGVTGRFLVRWMGEESRGGEEIQSL